MVVFAVVVFALMVVVIKVSDQPGLDVRCWWEQRHGWELAFPDESLPEEQFRAAIESQSKCVDLNIVYVNTDSVADGYVVQPIGARGWVGAGGAFQVLVESEPGRGTIECGEPVREPPPGAATEILGCGDE